MIKNYEHFTCWFCQGRGYLDFPEKEMPCPIEEHKDKADRNLKKIKDQIIIPPKGYTPTGQQGGFPL